MKLSTLAGFALAGFLFFAWYGSRKSGNVTLENQLLDQNGIAEARMDAGAYDNRNLREPEEVSHRKRLQSAEPLAILTEKTTAKTTKSEISLGLNDLSNLAIAGALDKSKHIPAGTSLALLIYQAERGKQFTNSNLRTVIDYLQTIKQNANEQDTRSYFKYSSNSEKWFQGLELDRNGGHPVADLQRIYRQYQLQKYDKNAYVAITGKTSTLQIDERIEPETEAPAMDGDPAENEVRSNQARAMNRWAEQESRGTRAETRFLPAEEGDENAARQEVQRLRVGQSITFDEPDTYHAAVKEMIALENGYASWKDYEKNTGKDKAKRTFRKRAEQGGVMATGTLKVTREK